MRPCGARSSPRGRGCAAWSPWPPRSTLPEDTPLRPELVVIALVVTVGTLLLQGTTLPALARALGVRGPDPRQDALQEATVLGATTGAGLRMLEQDPDADRAVVDTIRAQAADRVNRSWERLGTLGPGDAETPAEARARLRLAMIREERTELLRIRDRGGVDHEVLTSILGQLDAEETALAWGATRAADLRDGELRPPDRVAGACEHLAATEVPHAPLRSMAARPASSRACSGCTCGRARPVGRWAAATPPRAGTPRRTSTTPATR